MEKDVVDASDSVTLVTSKVKNMHQHGVRCLRLIGHVLAHDEKTIIEVKQSYLNSISPDRIIATNKRIIIVRPSFWGLYIGRNLLSPTEFSMVPYKNVISVVVSKGKFLSTINMRIHGFTDASAAIRNEGVVNGIRTRQAEKFMDFIEEIVNTRRDYGANGAKADGESAAMRIDAKEHAYAHSGIGIDEARRLVASSGKKMVWLGLEPLEYVAYLLGVSQENLTKRDPKEIMELEGERLKEFEGCIFVAYSDAVSEHVINELKENGVAAYNLRGGILSTLHKRRR
ncbi:MAG: PH domain-containing protein [Candidatus Micrarchaeota archaeon]|nr:PH domain-containing protein [Candidatus Micrarchaeota archaeon]MDE1823920.1 PH domain-containing protein [Candidatus Micrarchaeota archaeon]MDE1849334.1 PH domain-containing protein [Candidatus Micrarchaeota archaeon]